MEESKLKMYYSTREVADKFGCTVQRIHQLMSEFQIEFKYSGRRRRINKKNYDKLLVIAHLLKVEKYTVAGIMRQLRRSGYKRLKEYYQLE